MSWTSWSARLSSLALNLPKVLASHTNQSATCFKWALASSANIGRLPDYCRGNRGVPCIHGLP
ncbi:MAG: hypothetical protein IJ139_00950 [Bacteroidaceae bacterium]|nr:hypothetical protein [Bacteroidaceae bacterium]MBQ9175419.1 hypothetical protein [Bacteroidaceae bacterium]